MTREPDDRQSWPEPSPATAARKRRNRLDPAARRRIGQNLRALYAEVLSQPLPERFETLLADLAASLEPEEPSR
ncbi:NepR family anti-sigma factor [Methylobacterium durans]|nr:NepR family anti-sigma factor [Methylobacterium durans]MEA1835208.1 NepR family anti-sigma factor [Methylobacterium durans]